MTSPRPDCPKGRIGERVVHRANQERTGVITAVSIDAQRAWCTVKWDHRKKGPRVVHRYELRLLPDAEAKTKG